MLHFDFDPQPATAAEVGVREVAAAVEEAERRRDNDTD